MRRFWELEPLAIPHADHEHPPAQLRHTVLRSEQDSPCWCISEILQLPEQTCELRSVSAVGEALHVFEDKGAGLGLSHDPHVLVQQRSVRIRAGALLLEPEARLGERRAGRPADHQAHLANAQVARREQIGNRKVADIGLDCGHVREVRPEAGKGSRVVVRGGGHEGWSESSGIRSGIVGTVLQGEVETSRTREQAHDRETLSRHETAVRGDGALMVGRLPFAADGRNGVTVTDGGRLALFGLCPGAGT